MGDVLDVGVDVVIEDDVVVGDALGDCVEVGAGVDTEAFGLGACGLGAVRKGTKLTVPKWKLSLES